MHAEWERAETTASQCDRCSRTIEGTAFVREDPSGATMGLTACCEDCAEWIDETLEEPES